jgi:hypothetical protein
MPKKISRLSIKIAALRPAITEYLFLLKYPVSMTQSPKRTESKEA